MTAADGVGVNGLDINIIFGLCPMAMCIVVIAFDVIIGTFEGVIVGVRPMEFVDDSMSSLAVLWSSSLATPWSAEKSVSTMTFADFRTTFNS